MGPQGGAWAYMWKPEGSPEAARGFATAPKYQPGLLVLSGLLANDRFGGGVDWDGMGKGWVASGANMGPTWIHMDPNGPNIEPNGAKMEAKWGQVGPTLTQMSPKWSQIGSTQWIFIILTLRVLPFFLK